MNTKQIANILVIALFSASVALAADRSPAVEKPEATRVEKPTPERTRVERPHVEREPASGPKPPAEKGSKKGQTESKSKGPGKSESQQHMEKAAKHQDKAIEKSENKNTLGAIKEWNKAEKELLKAIEAQDKQKGEAKEKQKSETKDKKKK